MEKPDLAVERSEMLQRASDLVPAIKARAQETEELCHLPGATVKELHESGLWRAVQPSRVGGGGFDFGLIVELADIFGLACGSTAWTYANLAVHHWMLANWPEQAQDTIWGPDPNTLIATSVIFPAARAKRVKDGYRLTGRWPFCSGILHCDWSIHGGLVDPEHPDGNDEPRIFIVPKEELEIFDTWHAMGLRGTGSRDVACQDLFVPDYMTIAAADVKGGDHPGMGINPALQYRLPMAAMFSHPIASPLLGIANGAYHDTVKILQARASTFNKSKLSQHLTLQRAIAKSGALIDSARLLLRSNCSEALTIAESGESFAEEVRFRWRRDAAHAADMCIEAVELLYRSVGGSAVYSSHPLQRFLRDIQTGANHIGVSFDVNGSAYGRIALGLPSDNPII
ncbi:acyl-CoA dehydrogenase [Pseudomonadota bacterium]